MADSCLAHFFMTASYVSWVYVFALHSLYLLLWKSFMGPSVEKKTILGFCPFSPATFVAIIMKTHEFVVFPGSGPIGQGPTLVGGRSPRGSGG